MSVGIVRELVVFTGIVTSSSRIAYRYRDKLVASNTSYFLITGVKQLQASYNSTGMGDHPRLSSYYVNFLFPPRSRTCKVNVGISCDF